MTILRFFHFFKFALLSNHFRVGRSFWRRLRAQHPNLKKKRLTTVSVSRGLNCTRDMAIEYIDQLAQELIDVGIATDMEQLEPGVWEGDVDTSRYDT